MRYAAGPATPRPGRNAGTGRQAQPPAAGLLRVEFLRRAARELDLTGEQQDKLDKIIKDSQERARKVLSPYLREEMQRTRTEFRDVLTAEQRPKFDELLKQQQQQQQQRAREMHHPAGPGERPPEAAPAEPAK